MTLFADDGDGGHVGAVHPVGGGDRVGGEELAEHGVAAETIAGSTTCSTDRRTAGARQGSRS